MRHTGCRSPECNPQIVIFEHEERFGRVMMPMQRGPKPDGSRWVRRTVSSPAAGIVGGDYHRLEFPKSSSQP
jgi:hypothetical protein